MSNAEMIATAIVGHIHELHAGMAPLLIQLRLSEAPLDIYQQLNTVYDQLAEIMTKTINNYTKSGGSGSQETYEPLFTELKAEAKKLHQITLLLMKNEDVYKEGEIRNLVDSIEEALRDSLLSGEGR